MNIVVGANVAAGVGQRNARELTPNLDAERAVLGAILIDNTMLKVAAAAIGPATFFRNAHQRIFKRMLALAERSQAIDLVTLKEDLERAGELDDCGGPAYLASLVDGVPRSINVEYYAGIVRDHAARRRLIELARNLATGAAADEDLQGLSERVAAELSSPNLFTGPTVGALVDLEMERERARREARRRLDIEDRGHVPEPEIATLRDRLSRPQHPVRFRIAGWQPSGARVMLAAQFKAGKTTLVGSLTRSLVDGDPFLGIADVAPVAGTVALLDFEMGDRQFDDWLRAQGIRNDDRVIVIPLRGRAAAFNIIDRGVRKQWADRLRANGVQYLILDCLRPVLDALGLDEHRDAGRFLVAFDALLSEAGILEALIVHHMGHAGERTRGDSRLRDWPDAEWRLVRQDDDPASTRFLSAYGRDVDVTESALQFDASSRRLTIAGGSRQEAAVDAALLTLLEIIGEDELSGRSIETACREAGLALTREGIRAALQAGLRSNALVARAGDKRAILHRRGPCAPVRGCAPSVDREQASVCAAPFRGARTRALDGSDLSAPSDREVTRV